MQPHNWLIRNAVKEHFLIYIVPHTKQISQLITTDLALAYVAKLTT